MVVRAVVLFGLKTVTLTERDEVLLDVAELKTLRFSLGEIRMDEIKMSASEGKLRLSNLEAKLERQGEEGQWILDQGCLLWSCQAREKEEGHRGGLWM